MKRLQTIIYGSLALLVLGVLVYVVLGFTARAMAEMKVKELLAGMQDVVEAQYEEVDVSLLDLAATVRDLRVAVIGGVEFTVGELQLSRFEQLDGMPRSLSMSARGVRIPLAQPALEQSGSRLRKLGYDVLALDYDLDFEYDPKTRAFQLHELKLFVRDAGELRMQLALSNVDLAALLRNGPQMVFMGVQHGELRYEDHSLVSRIFELLAEEEGASAQDVRATLEQGLGEREAKAAAGGDTFSATALAALRQFLHNPGTISILARPAADVTIIQLMALNDPVDMLKLLNMHFEAETK